MAAPIRPALKQAFGNDSWGFVPAVADITAPTVAELTATGGFNLSCSLFAEQDGLSGATEKVTLPRILCETESYEINGATTFSMADIQVSFDPQATSGADGKKAWETLTDGIEGFMWRRQGVSATTDVATGAFVDVVPVQLGTKVPTKTGTGTDGVYSFTQAVSVTGKPAFNVAVVAGA